MKEDWSLERAIQWMVTESQHGWGWKGPLEVTLSNPCFSMAIQSRLPSNTFRWFLQISKEETAHLWATSAGAPSPVQRRSTSWCSDGVSCPGSGHHQRELFLSLLLCPFSYLLTFLISLLSLLQAEQYQLIKALLTGEMLQSLHHLGDQSRQRWLVLIVRMGQHLTVNLKKFNRAKSSVLFPSQGNHKCKQTGWRTNWQLPWGEELGNTSSWWGLWSSGTDYKEEPVDAHRWSAEGQVGRGFRQAELVEGIPAQSRRLELDGF